jgi:hypothetical protein
VGYRTIATGLGAAWLWTLSGMSIGVWFLGRIALYVLAKR